jgi:hypothetical protein
LESAADRSGSWRLVPSSTDLVVITPDPGRKVRFFRLHEPEPRV